MKLDVIKLDGGKAGSIELNEALFGLEPRADVLHRVVRWQRAKAQAGTHSTLGTSDVSYSTKKIYRQKGTGGARHGSARVAQFRGGGRAFGPVVRSHAHDLPKKVRALALRHALSVKAKSGELIIWQDAAFAEPKTKALRAQFDKLGFASALIIDGSEPNDNFRLAARSIPKVDVLPIEGINVYDIIRREKLVLTKAALEALEARFK